MTKESPAILRQFGAAVRTLRKERGISQEELAHLSGLHRTYITDIERGARNVSLKNIERISQAVGLQLSDVFVRFEREAASASGANGPVEILLVEDDERFIDLTLLMLKDWNIGNSVHVERNGTDALAYLAGASGRLPSVILLDLSMPSSDGFDVLHHLRNDRQNSCIPVIVMTASANDVDRERCAQYGVEEYLTMPVDAFALSSVMARLGFRMHFLHAGPVARPKNG